MKLKEYFINATTDEITERLKYLDKAIYELHTIKSEKENAGRYVVGNLADIEIIDGDITIDSFHNKYDYLDSGMNDNATTNNIIQLCCIGIYAYCRFSKSEFKPELMEDICNNTDKYLMYADMPSEMRDYYSEVFYWGKVMYLNDYLMEKMNEYNKNEVSRSNGKGALVKSTPAGKMFINQENNLDSDLIKPYMGSTGVSRTLPSYEKAAYASILLLPALLAFVYILTVVVYFIFFK